MKKFKYIIVTQLFLLSLFTQPSVQAEVVVIVNPDNASSISKKDVKRIYLGKTKKFSNGNSANPVNLPAGDKNRTTFEKKTVGKSSKKMKAYWAKLIFSGKGNPPKKVSNDAEVIDIVSKDANAIGYIDSSNLNDKVKVIDQ